MGVEKAGTGTCATESNFFSRTFGPLSPRQGAPLMRYVVSKGYVALDGTSLTVCLVHTEEEWFTIMMVPHTLENVVTGRKQAGDVVNVEYVHSEHTPLFRERKCRPCTSRKTHVNNIERARKG